jgi:nucleoprotein TPR
MAAVALDAPYLAAAFNVPEPTIQSLLVTPTTELVETLFQRLTERAKEFEVLSSEKFRADVDLQNATRNSDRKAQALKTNLDKAHKDLEELRRKVDEEG